LFIFRDSIFPENAWEEKRIELIALSGRNGNSAGSSTCDNWSATVSRDTEFSLIPGAGNEVQSLLQNLPPDPLAVVGAFGPSCAWPDCAALVSSLIAPQSPEAARMETLWAYKQSGPGVFKGDLYFYRVDGDLRGRVETIETKVCPLYLLTGEYDFSCTPEDTKRTAAAMGAPASPSWSSSVIFRW
jgi:hypothetical protein